MADHLIGVVLTAACNLRCEYCRIARQPRAFLEWDVLRQSIDALLPVAGSVEVTFTGGEPLLAVATLRREVSYIEQKIGRPRVRWRVLTNGLLLDAETLSFLDAHHFLVNVSMDGVPHAQSPRGAWTFEQLERLFGNIRENHPGLFNERLTVSATLSPNTVSDLADSVGYFIRSGIKAFAISPVRGQVEWDTARIVELERQFAIASASLLRHYESTGEVPLLLFRKSMSCHESKADRWACGVLAGHCAVVDVDGNTCACLAATHTYQPCPVPALRSIVGALRLGPACAPEFAQRRARLPESAPVAQAVNHPDRRYSSYRKCADCEFLGRCHVCPLASASVPGWDDVYRVSDFLCAFNQVALAARDSFPAQPDAEDFFMGRVPLSALRFSRPTAAQS